VQSVIELPDGIFLAESKVGAGRVFYCAAPATTVFGNFPVTGLFVALVNRAATLMTASPLNGMESTVGQPVNVSIAGKFSAGTFKILDPNNVESLRQSAILPSGALITLDALRQPGVYAVQAQNGTIVQTISVNPPASESAMVTLPADDLKKSLAERTHSADQIRTLDNPQQFNPDVLRAGAGTELWKLFLVAALLCAVAESLVARRAASAGQQ
jgi:hypothetical protein